MKKYIIALMVLCGCELTGQEITGHIANKQSENIHDAVVYVNSLENHTHTDFDGNFTLENVSKGDTLFVQYLGYEKYRHIITTSDFDSSLKILLQETDFMLDQIYIDNSIKSFNSVSNIDLKKNPVNSSQEILQKVPGLFIAQHAGGGKAEQIFLRGFDIDHGTDIAINVDGMPVNMVSHAHGQGYSDLHFLIPETIDQIDFGKGPYYADKGNFNTAGYVDFKTKNALDGNLLSFEAGRFNTFRTLAMLDLISTQSDDLYLATEFLLSDGPFESPQNFNRGNALAKYRHKFNDTDFIEIQVSHFNSNWDASGQIPQRLVDTGTISRFGAVDNTEGGNTSRSNFGLSLTKRLAKNSYNKLNLFYNHYDFRLWSNFTFFLDDPVNGDQIRQSEDRHIIGLSDVWFYEFSIGDAEIDLSAGLGFRYDNINDNELSKTVNRSEIRERIRFGNVDESNFHAFFNPSIHFGTLTINPALRIDYFDFQYQDLLSSSYSVQSKNKARLSPKLNLFVNPGLNLQLYLKSGIGFHSNDSRVVLLENAEEILPAAYSLDIGAIWKPIRPLWINLAAWYLELEQEFVYVGDAGIVEPSGATRRKGIELSIRYDISKAFYFHGDINYSYARAIDEPEGENYIPLAPDLTALASIYYNYKNKLTAGLRSRYIKDRAANEDNSIVAKGYFVSDMNMNYQFNKTLGAGFVIENLFNVDWNEAQFATLSRLSDEANPVEEIHFTPGVPFFMKFRLNLSF